MPPRRILLDECVDRHLASHVEGHTVETCHQRGWDGVKNGELMKLASESFDVFITVDRNLSFQQNLSALPIAVIVLHGTTNRLQDLLPLVPELLAVVPVIARGEVREIAT